MKIRILPSLLAADLDGLPMGLSGKISGSDLGVGMSVAGGALWDEIDERSTRPARVARFHAPLPTIFHSVWRAPDGRVAAVLVNWTRKPQPYELKTPDLTISGTLSPRGWQCVEF